MEQAGTLSVIEDGEAWVHADRGTVLFQPGRGLTVECPAMDFEAREGCNLLDTAEHLLCRFPCKRNEEDLMWVDAGCDEPSGATDQDFGFSAPGSGDDQEGAERGTDNGQLFRVEGKRVCNGRQDVRGKSWKNTRLWLARRRSLAKHTQLLHTQCVLSLM